MNPRNPLRIVILTLSLSKGKDLLFAAKCKGVRLPPTARAVYTS